jgi:hypothetical protein
MTLYSESLSSVRRFARTLAMENLVPRDIFPLGIDLVEEQKQQS